MPRNLENTLLNQPSDWLPAGTHNADQAPTADVRPDEAVLAQAAAGTAAWSEAPRTASRPRVWPVPVVLVLSLGAYLGFSLLALLLAAWILPGAADAPLFGEGGRVAAVPKSPLGLAIILVLPQIAMTIPAVLAATASPQPLAGRLGLVRGRWPLWLWVTAALGTPLIGMISSAIVGAWLGESESLDEMSGLFRTLGENGWLLPLALLVGITPGICEELLFRGYVQTRMTTAWGPPLGILATSLVFAVFHMDLVHSVAVIALGVYLGWIAWASGTILTAMLAHFLNNFLSVFAVVLLPKSLADAAPAVPDAGTLVPAAGEVIAVAVLGGVVLLSGLCLLVTLFEGFRRGGPPRAHEPQLRAAGPLPPRI